MQPQPRAPQGPGEEGPRQHLRQADRRPGRLRRREHRHVPASASAAWPPARRRRADEGRLSRRPARPDHRVAPAERPRPLEALGYDVIITLREDAAWTGRAPNRIPPPPGPGLRFATGSAEHGAACDQPGRPAMQAPAGCGGLGAGRTPHRLV